MERITLNMVPTGVLEICHASQYDIGREIGFDLIDGTDDFVLSGDEDITIFIRDFDGNLIESSAPNTSSNYVVWTSSEGELDVSGPAICELRVTKDDDVLGSANFIMEIEADPYADTGVHVETVGPADICTFETNLAEPLQSVIVDVEATGGNGTPDSPIPINGYTEANITRCGVNLLPNCTAESHTANSVTVTCNSDGTFTSTGTATGGNFLHDYTMTQNLNIISGMYLHCGNDFNSATLVLGFRYTDGTGADFTLSSNNRIIDLSSYVGKKVNKIRIYGANGTVMNGTIMPMVLTVNAPTAYTPYNGQTYTIAFGQTVYGGVLDVTRGKLTVTHATFDLGDIDWTYNSAFTVFRGDITGCINNPAVNSEHIPMCSIYEGIKPNYATVINNEQIMYNVGGAGVYVKDTSYTDASIFKTAMSGVQLVYELATPFDIDLTPVQISALVGVNNVFADCGQSTVKYLKAGA